MKAILNAIGGGVFYSAIFFLFACLGCMLLGLTLGAKIGAYVHTKLSERGELMAHEQRGKHECK